MKIIFIYEDFHEPFDEGVKNFARMVHGALAHSHDVSLIRDVPRLHRILNSQIIVQIGTE